MSDKVSVIIPCYNQGKFLVEAVDSILAQTFKNTEIIVIDDGSTDNTAEVAKGYGDRIIYLTSDHSGPSRPRNIGLARTTGNYIQFLDADDVLLPTKLERQLATISRDGGLAASYCDYYRGRGDAVYEPYEPPSNRLNPRIYGSSVLYELARQWETHLSIPPICFLFDARIFREHGIRLDESLPNHVDWDCWLQIARLPVQWSYLDEKLAIYRVTPGSITKNLRRMRTGFIAAIDKHIELAKGEPDLRRILLWKRHETLVRYDRNVAKGMSQPWKSSYVCGRAVYRQGSRILRRLGLL